MKIKGERNMGKKTRPKYSHTVLTVIAIVGIFVLIGSAKVFLPDLLKSEKPGKAETKQNRFSIDTSQARPYSIINKMDFSMHNPYRKRIKYYLFSDASTRKERAHTAILAALELAEKDYADFVTVRITPFEFTECCSYIVAKADYAPDGKGISGKGINETWDVTASDLKITEDTVDAVHAMKKAEKRGMDNISKIKKFIANQTGLPTQKAEQIYFDMIALKSQKEYSPKGL